jgi:hypothetical protein
LVTAIQKGGKKKERMQGVKKFKKKETQKTIEQKRGGTNNRETKKEIKEKQKTDKLIKA